MKRRKNRVRMRLLSVLALLLILLTSFVLGKYFQTVSFDGKVTFSAELVNSIVLRESKIIQNDNGSYGLAVNEYVQSDTQNYTLIPGLDVPKNPHIIISGKTNIAAYLFVEVKSTVDPGTLSYSVDAYSADNIGGVWKKLDVQGKNGGEVYVYTGGGGEPLLLTDDPENPIYILKDNMVTVSQHLLHESVSDEDDLLAFYVSMGDAALGDPSNAVADEIDVYNAIHGTT